MNKNNIEAFKKYYKNVTKEQVIDDMFVSCYNLGNENDRLQQQIINLKK